jgi:hypothetical protein
VTRTFSTIGEAGGAGVVIDFRIPAVRPSVPAHPVNIKGAIATSRIEIATRRTSYIKPPFNIRLIACQALLFRK